MDLAALDEGRPFNILPNGQLFDQCGAGRPSKQLDGCIVVLPTIHTGTENGKELR